MKILITGGCGFLGSNLAAQALARGDELAIFDNLARVGAAENLSWLQGQGKFKFVRGDIRTINEVRETVRSFAPDCVFHLAGQVAMTTSIEDPRKDFEINSLGTLNILEALRAFAPKTSFIYSSTNKVYGDLEQYTYLETDTRYRCVERPNGFDETTPLDFHSPYGCSKGAADQYVLDYARIFDQRTVVLRHSSMYGGRQYATYDQGWVGWFCKCALATKRGVDKEPFTISGSGKQVRDVLHADDMVGLYFALAQNMDRVAGQAFNIGGGMANSLSLLELFSLLERDLDIQLRYTRLPIRTSDQKIFVADVSKIERLLGWTPRVRVEHGLKRMLSWVTESA